MYLYLPDDVGFPVILLIMFCTDYHAQPTTDATVYQRYHSACLPVFGDCMQRRRCSYSMYRTTNQWLAPTTPQCPRGSLREIPYHANSLFYDGTPNMVVSRRRSTVPSRSQYLCSRILTLWGLNSSRHRLMSHIVHLVSSVTRSRWYQNVLVCRYGSLGGGHYFGSIFINENDVHVSCSFYPKRNCVGWILGYF